MARVFSVHVGSGGVPKPAMAFIRAGLLDDGKATLRGYVFGPENSPFLSLPGARKLKQGELDSLGFGNINLADWGSANRPHRERFIIEIPNGVDDTRYHNADGDQAVCLFALERILTLQSQLPLFPGSLGENIVTQDVGMHGLTPGLLVGFGHFEKRGMVLRITGPRQPCKTIELYAALSKEITENKTPNVGKALGFVTDPSTPGYGGSGFYASIEKVWGTGIILPGDSVFFPSNP